MLSFIVFCLAACLRAGAVQVSTPDALQAAIDSCLDGCRIELVAREYLLSRPVVIENRRDVEIVGIGTTRPALRWNPALLADVANPHAGSGVAAKVPKLFTLSWKDMTGTDDPLRPAGWLMWPKTGSTPGLRSNGPGGSTGDTANPYSTNGFQQNGMILVHGSRDVLLENLELDGVKQAYFINTGIWSQKYSVLFGNTGVNLQQALRARVVGCEIHDFWNAIYLNDRNWDCRTYPNPDDIDKSKMRPFKSCGTMGSHLVESNLIHDNWWVAYSESEWDMGSVFRANFAWKNRQDTRFPYGGRSDVEMTNHTGGFLFAKDAVYPSHVVSGNTMIETPFPIGHMGWRAGNGTLFSDNLVGPIPWIRSTDWHQILPMAYAARTRGNVFLLDPSTGTYKIAQVSKVKALDGTFANLSPAVGVPRDSFPLFQWRPLLGRTLSAQGISWFDSLALDSTSRLRLPKMPGRSGYDTTDNLAVIVPALRSIDTTMAISAATRWATDFASTISGKGFLGRTAGFAQPPTAPSVAGMLWGSGTPSMDSAKALHLPLRVVGAEGFSTLSIQDIVVAKRDCGLMVDMTCKDTVVKIAFDDASYSVADGEFVLPLAGKLALSGSTVLQVDLWAGAKIGDATLPLTPATWTWSKGMTYSSGKGPVAAAVRGKSVFRIGSIRRQTGRWILSISGAPANAPLAMCDLSGREAALTRIGESRFATEARHSGTWFVRVPGQPAQRVFLTP